MKARRSSYVNVFLINTMRFSDDFAAMELVASMNSACKLQTHKDRCLINNKIGHCSFELSILSPDPKAEGNKTKEMSYPSLDINAISYVYTRSLRAKYGF